MFQTPYSSTIGSKYNLETVFSGIRRAEINDDLAEAAGIKLNADIKLVSPRSKDFPPFTQPILRRDMINARKDMDADAVVDGRAFLRAKEDTALKSDIYQHYLRYAKMSLLWSESKTAQRNMMTSSDYHIKAFGGWLSGEISRRLALDPTVHATLRMCLIIHFIQMGDDRLKFEGNSKDAQMAIVTMASRKIPGSAPLPAFENMLNGSVPYLGSLEDTVKWIKELVDTPTIAQLNVPFIYALVNGSTFPSLRDTLAIGLEYPPAFIVLVYGALTERGANKTGLGRHLLNSKDRNAENHFIRMVDYLLEEPLNG